MSNSRVKILVDLIRKKIRAKLSINSRANLKNSSYSILGALVTMATLLVITPLLLFKLGKDGMGVFVLIRSIIGFGGMLSLGMGNATLRFVAKYKALNETDKAHRVVRTTLTYYLCIGVLAGVGLYLIADTLANHVFEIPSELRNSAALAFQIGGIGLLVGLIAEALGSALKGNERFDLSVSSDVAIKLLAFALQVYVLSTGGGLVGLVSVLIFSQFLGIFLRAYQLVFQASPGLVLFPLYDRECLKETLSFGLYTWIGGLFNRLTTEGPSLLLGIFAGSGAVAVYSIATRVLQQVTQLTASSTSYLFPYLTRLHESDEKEELERHYYQVSQIFAVLASAVVSPLILIGGPLLRVWLPDGEALGVFVVLEIIALRFVMFPLGVINYCFIVATNNGKALVIVQAISCVVTLAATLAGAMMGGLMGVAWAQLSVFVVIVGNRMFIERSLFSSGSFVGQIGLIAAVLIPCIVAQFATVPIETSLVKAILLGGLFSLFAAFLSFAVYQLHLLLRGKRTFLRVGSPVT